MKTDYIAILGNGYRDGVSDDGRGQLRRHVRVVKDRPGGDASRQVARRWNDESVSPASPDGG